VRFVASRTILYWPQTNFDTRCWSRSDDVVSVCRVLSAHACLCVCLLSACVPPRSPVKHVIISTCWCQQEVVVRPLRLLTVCCAPFHLATRAHRSSLTSRNSLGGRFGSCTGSVQAIKFDSSRFLKTYPGPGSRGSNHPKSPSRVLSQKLIPPPKSVVQPLLKPHPGLYPGAKSYGLQR
jgi:hypothetical protein